MLPCSETLYRVTPESDQSPEETMTTVGRPPRIPTQRTAPTSRLARRRFVSPSRPRGIGAIPQSGSAEFPLPHFPSGVGVPPLVLLGTLLIAAVGLTTIRMEEPVVVLGGPPGWPGAVPAAAIALVAVWAWLTLRVTVVAPVRRLPKSVLGRSRGRRVHRSFVRDVDRILTSLREIDRPAFGRPLRRNRCPRLPMIAVLGLVGLVVLGALGLSFVVLSRNTVVNAQVLAVETGQDAARAGDRLRSVMLGGLSTLQGVAGPAAGGGSDLQAVVSRVLADRSVFRAVYVLDPSGRQVAAAGSAREGDARVRPVAGISQLNTSGSTPLIMGAVPLYDGKTLVGEYDPRALCDLLRGPDARLRVVDAGLRTILSNQGYQAFSELRDRELRTAAATPAAAGPAPVAAVRTVDHADATVVAQRLGADGDPLAALKWVLVAHEDLRTAEFAHDPVGRGATVVSALAAGITVALLGWIYVATVRPLRAAAAHAAAIGAARTGAPPPGPAPAERVDEIGAIITGLNQHLHSVTAVTAVTAVAPTSLRTIPLPIIPVGPSRPLRRSPGRIPAAGSRRLVQGGSASCRVDDQAARYRDQRVHEADIVVLAGR
jgi:hypothetical protein